MRIVAAIPPLPTVCGWTVEGGCPLMETFYKFVVWKKSDLWAGVVSQPECWLYTCLSEWHNGGLSRSAQASSACRYAIPCRLEDTTNISDEPVSSFSRLSGCLLEDGSNNFLRNTCSHLSTKLRGVTSLTHFGIIQGDILCSVSLLSGCPGCNWKCSTVA